MRHVWTARSLPAILLGVFAATVTAAPGPPTAEEAFASAARAQEAVAAKADVHLGPWYYAGPFDGGFDTVLSPEKGVDLKATYAGKGGVPVTWQQNKRFKDGQPNDITLLPEGEPFVVYLYRTVTADTPGRMPVSLGSDDTLTAWLNGTRVLARNASRAVRLGEDRAVLDLKGGVNHLLLKVCNTAGRAGFAFAPGFAGEGVDLWDEVVSRVRQECSPAEAHRAVVMGDWLRRDGFKTLQDDFREPAGRALDLARRTLAEVSKRRALPGLAAELAALQKKHASAAEDADWTALYFQTRWLRRRIALEDPLLDFERLFINKRPPPLYSHMCDQYLGRHSRPGPGPAILDHWRTAPTETAILAGKMPEGSFFHPDLSFDATRILFSFCDHTEQDRNKRAFYIWEAAVDGSWVRQLTGVPGRDKMETMGNRHTVLVEDFDPCYLPGNQGFVFVSTRNQGFGRCHGGRYTPAYILYRADPEGSNIRPISYGEANEWDPSVLADGSIVYTRWDYINRHDCGFQSLWQTRPDGTATAHYYGNYTRSPDVQFEPRAIPNSTKIVCTAGAHHSYTCGTILVVDNHVALDGEEPVTRVTPEVPYPERRFWNPSEGIDSTYATPWPLSEEVFLVAYSPDKMAGQGRVQRANAYGIYLIDTWGGRELIYRDPDQSCFSPVPFVARQEPHVLPSYAKSDQDSGIFYVQDVYEGIPTVPRGTVKRLRVVEIIGQPTAGAAARGPAANEVVKGVVGTVPVEPDGSVAFRAPARKPLLFQLLDENDMAVMIMRSQAYLQPGEVAGCAGCHESRTTSPLATVPTAQHLKVRDLAPPAGPVYEGGLSFARTVQPVLDRYCIRCHGLGGAQAAGKAARADGMGAGRADLKPLGRIEDLLEGNSELPAVMKPKAAPPAQAQAAAPKGLSLLGTPERQFNQAFSSLLRQRGFVNVAQRNGEKDVSEPNLYGSHAGRLAGFLLTEHRDKVQVDPASFARIAQWLDLNGQYYGDYGEKGGVRAAEQRQPDPAAEQDLRAHVRQACGTCHVGMEAQPLAALLNVAIPVESRVLMAPLAAEAGGWGQCKARWAVTADKGYQQMLQKVKATAGEAAAVAAAR